jgi:hypothetical protein
MFFVKSKGRSLKLRDGESGKMLDVGPSAWVPFSLLPRNMAGATDADFLVREALAQEDLAAIDAENTRMAEGETRRKAVAEPVESEPRSQRKHRR